MLYNNTLLLVKARGGSHMTGEGGDEVFGLRRATILRRFADNPKYLSSPSYLKLATIVLGPRVTRLAAQQRVNRKALGPCLKHLRPGLAEEVIRQVSEHLASEPLDTAKSLAWHLRRRGPVMYQEAITAFSLEYDVYHVDPFLEPRFIASYARTVRPFGLATRSDAMHLLFSDLLPDQILTRSSKALFNRGFLTDVGRAFASSWDGGGVDTGLVDVDALRAAWLSRWPPVQSFWLLQAAWLHENQPAEARLA
jgi:asparagine synthase (glutamine-hydrolysing)